MLGFFIYILIAAGGFPAAAEEPVSALENPQVPRQIKIRPAVKSIEVQFFTTKPFQANLIVSGEFPDMCMEITDIKIRRKDKAFVVTLIAGRAEEAICVPMITTFRQVIPLELEDLSPGDYFVKVNGIRKNFVLEKDSLVELFE